MYRIMTIKNLAAIILSSFMIDCYLVGNIGAQGADGNEDQLFAASFEDLVNKAAVVTHNYDIQLEKWKSGEHSNTTMVSITDSYLPKFQELITIAKKLNTPEKFEDVRDLYLKSLDSELQSNILFRNNLVSVNATETMLSSKLYSDALRYEIESFRAFESAVSKTNNDS